MTLAKLLTKEFSDEIYDGFHIPMVRIYSARWKDMGSDSPKLRVEYHGPEGLESIDLPMLHGQAMLRELAPVMPAAPGTTVAQCKYDEDSGKVVLTQHVVVGWRSNGLGLRPVVANNRVSEDLFEDSLADSFVTHPGGRAETPDGYESWENAESAFSDCSREAKARYEFRKKWIKPQVEANYGVSSNAY